MRDDEFKRRLRALVREELERTNLRALVYEALASMDIQSIVYEALHDEFYDSRSVAQCNNDVLH